MSSKIVVAVIHGMGNIQADFADEFIADIISRIDDSELSERLTFVPIHWNNVTQDRQNAYFARANEAADLHYKTVRRFVLSALGDAAAYQRLPEKNGSTYQQIHRLIDDKLDLDVAEDTPIVVIAHSLGAHIMSNYIWDKQRAPDEDASDYGNMATLAGMITFGCNLPLFSFAADEPEPIAFPGTALCDPLKTQAKWLNFYDKDDVLGYPLKVINEAYDEVVDEDIEVNIGNVFQAWNPFSHDVYWQDRDITRPIARYLKTLLTATN